MERGSEKEKPQKKGEKGQKRRLEKIMDSIIFFNP